ncbi:transmembrane protein 33-like [Artemia franciscana]|uniref:transmembrane protein 33-like n=1 Tax=Artemia franciscana TaxID=6661 RepID=UPI0032D9BF82
MNEPKRDLQETESHGESISRLQKDREEGPYTQIPPDLRPSIHSKSEPQSSALSQPDVSSSLANKRQDLFKEKISYLIEGVQLITRIFTLASALLYIFSSFRSAGFYYCCALLASAVTNALRCIQLCQTAMHRKLVLEDSFLNFQHSLVYMLGSLTLVTYRILPSLILLPPFMYAILHLSSRCLCYLDGVDRNRMRLVRMIIGVVEVQSVTILQIVAFCDIVTLPLLVFTIPSLGCLGLFYTFCHCCLLILRCMSMRNPYTKLAFRDVSTLFDKAAKHPKCPSLLQSCICGSIEYVRNTFLKISHHISPH